MATGTTAREAAEALCISERTVHDHLMRARRALETHNLLAALLAAGIVRIVEEPRPGEGHGAGEQHHGMATKP